MKYSSFYQQHCEEAKRRREKRNALDVFCWLIVWLVIIGLVVIVRTVVKYST